MNSKNSNKNVSTLDAILFLSGAYFIFFLIVAANSFYYFLNPGQEARDRERDSQAR